MSDQHSLLDAECKFLLDAILKRVELRQQPALAMLLAAGTFLSLGTQRNDAQILLVYQKISFLLVSAWEHNGTALRSAARYIRACIEPYAEGIGWEGYLESRFRQSAVFEYNGILSTAGLALVTQVVAYALALTKFQGSASEWTLLVAAFLASVATVGYSCISILCRFRQGEPSEIPSDLRPMAPKGASSTTIQGRS
jgi:hypothetical protein